MSLPIRKVKIDANEPAPFNNTTNKNLSFDLKPQLGVVNLDPAYALFRMQATVTETQAAHANATRPVGIAGGTWTTPPYGPECLVANAFLDAERTGRLENAIDCNVREQTLRFYSNTAEQIQSQAAYDGTYQWDEYKNPHTAFRRIQYPEKLTTVTYAGKTACELQPEIPIPAKRLCTMADGMKEFPLVATGEAKLSLELQDDAVTTVTAYDNASGLLFVARPVDISSGTEANRKVVTLANHYDDPRACGLWAGAPVNVQYKAMNASAGLTVEADTGDLIWDVNDNNFSISTATVTPSGTDFTAVSPATTAAVQGLTLQARFTNPTTSDTNPYSQTKLDLDVCVASAGLNIGDQFTWTHSGYDFTFTVNDLDLAGTDVSLDTYIQSIQHDASSQVILTMNDAFTQAAGQRGAFPSVQVPNSASVSHQINKATLVVDQPVLNGKELQQLQKQINDGYKIPYFVWEREADNINSGETRIAGNYRLSPMTANVLMPRIVGNKLNSDTDGLQNYRVLLNGTPTTDYRVSLREPLYHDRIRSTWKNMNDEAMGLVRPLGNLDELYSLTPHEAAYASPPALVCQPIPMVPEEIALELDEYNSGASSSKQYVFKQKQRVLEVKGTNVQVLN